MLTVKTDWMLCLQAVPNVRTELAMAPALVPNMAVHEASCICAYGVNYADAVVCVCRWIPATGVEVPEAKMLDIILYSREQVEKEHSALPTEDKAGELPDAPWGIISIKAQDEDHETPMQPITMMRNALGKDEGGSGVTLDKQKYQASVDYWRFRVPVLERD